MSLEFTNKSPSYVLVLAVFEIRLIDESDIESFVSKDEQNSSTDLDLQKGTSIADNYSSGPSIKSSSIVYTHTIQVRYFSSRSWSKKKVKSKKTSNQDFFGPSDCTCKSKIENLPISTSRKFQGGNERPVTWTLPHSRRPRIRPTPWPRANV